MAIIFIYDVGKRFVAVYLDNYTHYIRFLSCVENDNGLVLGDSVDVNGGVDTADRIAYHADAEAESYSRRSGAHGKFSHSCDPSHV